MNATIFRGSLLFALSGVAQTVIYRSGFETPTYSTGALKGQDGWTAADPGPTVVETTAVKSGTQAIGIKPSVSALDGAVRGVSYNAANKILTFSIDADFSATGTPSFWTVLGTQYNSSPPNIDFNIDQGGQMHISCMRTDHPTGVSITRGVWNHCELDVNLFNNTVSAFYNGAPVLPTATKSSRSSVPTRSSFSRLCR